MRKEILLIFILFTGGVVFSQNADLSTNNSEISWKIKNTIHSDINTVLFVAYWSNNYERTLIQNPGKNIIRFRTGLIYSFDSKSYGLPLGFTFLFGKSNRNYFELAAGIVPRILADSEEDGFGINGYLYYKYSIYPLFDLGYRFEPGPEKVFYRINVSWTGLGAGVGYSF